MMMLLTEIAPISEWTELENKVRNKTGLDVSVFDTEGIRITDNKEWINKLCPEIKSVDAGQTHICAVAHSNIAAMAAKSGKNIVEECDAGLIKAVVPLFKDDKFIGAFGGCGKMLDDGEIEVEYICRTIKSKEPEIAELSKSIEIMTEEAAEEAVEYMADEVAKILK
jgi:ligand-binding sensor protein